MVVCVGGGGGLCLFGHLAFQTYAFPTHRCSQFIHQGMYAHFGMAKCCNAVDNGGKTKRACCCCASEAEGAHRSRGSFVLYRARCIGVGFHMPSAASY